MRMYDIILKKREGEELSLEEIHYLIEGYVKKEIPDYQMAAFLMAVYFKGMTKEETTIMTKEVAHSGDMLDLSVLGKKVVDKHSTGGVGDKTTLIVGPIVASCGLMVAKMSGRGLGHTGGTIDKLESIPKMRTDLSQEEFFQVVNTVGISVIGQTGNMTPADKMLYALRDVTGTVDSIPLIAVSIMSKKLAAGSDGIVLDVKTGSGAFMKDKKDALALAKEMVSIGNQAGRPTRALLTNMDAPLGNAIGNTLEVEEAIATLNGNGPKDLEGISLALASHMLYVGGMGSLAKCEKMAKEALAEKKGLDVFAKMVKAQGGDERVVYHPEKLPKAPYQEEIYSKEEGYIQHMDTQKCGVAACLLGAGRQTKEDTIDLTAGIYLHKKTGDYVKKNEAIATFYGRDKRKINEAKTCFLEGLQYGIEPVKKTPLIYGWIKEDGSYHSF